MTAKIQSYMNPSLGIEELMQMPEARNLPKARELASSALYQTGLEGLYGAVNTRTVIESMLCPDVGDGTLVSPEVFNAELEAIVKKLAQSENPKIRTMLSEEIMPLLENGELLSAYRGLMIGG